MSEKKGIGGIVIALISALVILILATAVLLGSYISANNYAATAEENIKATYQNNQNILGQCTLKVQEVGQVPGMYADDLKGVITAAVTGRYGADGSKAVMQWIQEQNPTSLSTELYSKVQVVMESCRNQFTGEQTILVDRIRAYETAQRLFWKGMWIRTAGFPTIDKKDFKLVLASGTEEEFRTGKQEPIKLR